ncbi:MAG: RCC1 domain-containing protein [Spirochaetales bacterium]|nr:RCC1 domain-containing protein [Spirochaetales bacterium]
MNGTTIDSKVPVQVMSGVADMVAANGYSLVVKQDGSLWAAGVNPNGQLGDGIRNDSFLPKQILP